MRAAARPTSLVITSYSIHYTKLYEPYFLNTGMLHTGMSINRLGNFYASAIVDNLKREDYTAVFGPAYKGISYNFV